MKKPIMLIADDSKLIRHTYRSLFQADFEISEAVDGQEALTLIECSKNRLTVVLLDIDMPKLTGIDILTQLAATNKLVDLPIIVITADPKFQIQALNLGAWDFVVKSSKPEIIKARVKNVVGRKNFMIQQQIAEKSAQETLSKRNIQLQAIINITKDFIDKKTFSLAMHMALQRILNYFGSDRVYIFEINWLTNRVSNTYEECAPNITSELIKYQDLPTSDLDIWFSMFKENSYIRIHDIKQLNIARQAEYNVLKAQNITSLLAMPYYIEDKLCGFLGLDNPREHKDEVHMLKTLSYIIFNEMKNHEINQQNKKLLIKYDTLLKNAPGGIAIIDVCGDRVTPRFASEGFFKLLNISRDEFFNLYGNDAYAGVHPADVAAVKQTFLKSYYAKEKFTFTYRLINAHGVYTWVNINATILPDETGKFSYYGVYTDVTLEKLAQEKLRLTEERYHLALKNSHIFMWEYDIQHRCIVNSNQYLRPFGTKNSEKDIPESTIANGYIHPNSIAAYRNLYQRLHAGEQDPVADLLIKTDDTTDWSWRRIKYTTMYDNNTGKPTIAVAIGTDITEQKIFEERYNNEMAYREQIYKDQFALALQVNLTKNAMEYISIAYDPNLKTISNYEDFLQTFSETLSHVQRQQFLNIFNRNNLIQSYNNGNLLIEHTYQRHLADGNFKWVSTSVKMLLHPQTNYIIAFFTTTIIHEQYISKQLLDKVASQDYDYLVYLDGKNNSYIMFAGSSEDKTLPPAVSDDYETETITYANQFVIDNDIAYTINAMSLQNIFQQLDKNNIYEFTTHIRENNGEIRLKRLKYTYLDKTEKILQLSRVDITAIVEQINENQRLLELSQQDQLTGLYNKEYFRSQLNALTDTSINKCLFFIDIDNFKSVNDTFGHLAGDQTLKDIASILKDIFRKEDLIGRFGGDEFFIFVKDISPIAIKSKAQKICQQLQLVYGNETLGKTSISASLGIFTFHEKLSTDFILKCADKALYHAKIHKKGSFVFFEDLPAEK